LLIDDPVYFATFLPALKKNPSLPPLLFRELAKLNLTPSELDTILSDVGTGPGVEEPSGNPPVKSSLSLAEEAALLHLLQDHVITPTSLDQSLFISSEKFAASVFFDDVIEAYDELSNIHSQFSSTDTDPKILDSVNEIKSFSKEDAESSASTTDDTTYVFGGRNVSVSGGKYPLLKNPAAIAASNKLTLLGEMVFTGDTSSELIFLSAGSIDTADLISISHPGSLGFGSFDSLNLENVSLTANELNLRSLDSVILKNSSLVTTSTGSDFIHIIAFSEINAANISLQSREIIMSAMTINLSNITFPTESIIKLNSAYGGLGTSGRYPNFGSSLSGRVNFINDIRYGEILINNNSAFDSVNSVKNNITIGKLQ